MSLCRGAVLCLASLWLLVLCGTSTWVPTYAKVAPWVAPPTARPVPRASIIYI